MTDNVDAEAPVTETDARAMVRLLADVANLGGALTDKRKHLMSGLCDLIGADRWVWILAGHLEEGKMLTFSMKQHGGFSEQQMADFITTQEHPDLARFNGVLIAEYAKQQRHITRRNGQLISLEKYQNSEVWTLFAKAGIGPVMLSFYPLDSGHTAGIAIYRSSGKEFFTPRETRIAHIILSEVNWLYQESSTDSPVKSLHQLSPRLHSVFNLSLQGLGRKDIANHLGISIHTLNGYMKDLYLKFDVHTQAELIHRFMEGDGGDTPSI